MLKKSEKVLFSPVINEYLQELAYLLEENMMKALSIQVDDSLYPALLEILKNLPESKIKILEQELDNNLSFEEAMDYTLDKNKELYKRLS